MADRKKSFGRHGLVSRHVMAEQQAAATAPAAAAAGARRAAYTGIPPGAPAPSEAPAPSVTVPPGVTIGGAQGEAFFDRMFGGLPPLEATDDDLAQLANTMREVNPGDASLDNTNVPAGFTYLGQFVDHDITLDLNPLSDKVEDPTMLKNFRTPRLDLDCLYGAGPGPHRFLFHGSEPTFLIGTASPSPDASGNEIPALPNDLERTRHGVALIGDHRNDENLLVAQTHVAFLKFHNRVVDHLRASGTPDSSLFDEASRTVRWHYQWMVLHDFVERLTQPGIVTTLLTEGRKFYRFRRVPFMPLEFAGAAYRLGHSMVREAYSHNRVFRFGEPRLAPGTLDLLFQFSGLSGNITGELGAIPVLPSNWVIDWRRFYDFNTPPSTPTFEFNHARKLDPFLTPTLHTLPGFPDGREGNLAFRNLRRGVSLGLPSGQDVAAVMADEVPITPMTAAEIASGPDGAVAAQLGFETSTPLWYYILKEAQVKRNGERLGPVGGRIVAEVFVGLVAGDSNSYLSQPGWTPTLPARTPGTFFMTDLLQFVGDISPIDGITTVDTL
jgi:hypothetical protein